MKSFRKSTLKFLLFHNFLITCIIVGSAQKSVPGIVFQNIEKTNDTTTLFFYRSVSEPDSRFEILDLTNRVSYNSSYARGFNDGAVWKSKGVTFETHAGFAGKIGKISYQFMPLVFFSENANYDLAPANNSIENQFAYQFTNQIDWVQRYGSSSRLFFHPGQSELKFETGNFSMSLSTQNYSIGPSFFNPILLSQQGGGFPHLRLGSSPFDIGKFGSLEVNVLAGILVESDYYDEDSENDQRIFNGAFVNYSPAFLKNFKIGFGRVLYKQTRYFEFEDIFALITILEDEEREGLNTGNDTFDQMASLFAEWSFPEVRFRVYGEFAKNDFTGNSRWTLIEPEHTRGYTIGFEKIIETKSRKEVKIIYEHTNLSHNQAFLWRATPSFYSHGVNTQGYTNNGQLLGAGIGPGGNSDNLLIQLQNLQDQILGIRFQRIENNRDYFVRNVADLEEHDIEYSWGFLLSKKIEGFHFYGETTFSHNFNRYYEEDQSNLYLMIGTSVDL